MNAKEIELLRAFGLPLLELAFKMIAASRAKGVDLQALIAKAKAENADNIWDALGIVEPPKPK